LTNHQTNHKLQSISETDFPTFFGPKESIIPQPTIADVAATANVSKSTVSRVLNGTAEYMREETRGPHQWPHELACLSFVASRKTGGPILCSMPWAAKLK
jgi:hypothetical protein